MTWASSPTEKAPSVVLGRHPYGPPMPVPTDEVAACRAAHRRLTATVLALPPQALAAPSLLPDWSVAHLLTHLARNADSVVRRLLGAQEGRLVEQYDGGAAGRAREIEEGARRDPAAVVRDVVSTNDAVDRVFAECPEPTWDAPVLLVEGGQRLAGHLAASRWREVEVHHVDLGLAYTHRDWEDAFVQRFLPGVLTALPDRTDPAELLAWSLGRTGPPALSAWG